MNKTCAIIQNLHKQSYPKRCKGARFFNPDEQCRNCDFLVEKKTKISEEKQPYSPKEWAISLDSFKKYGFSTILNGKTDKALHII